MERNSCRRQKGELELAIPKEGLSVPTFNLKKASICQPLSMGWVHGQRGVGARSKKEGRARVHLHGVGSQDQGRRGRGNHVSTPFTSTMTCSLPGNQETMALTAWTSCEVC